MSDTTINKIATIERCITRIKTVYAEAGANFATDYTKQDSVVLNLQRACEASIDLANLMNKQHKTGVPQSSRDSFELLAKANLIPKDLAENLKKMVGLRNIAVREYQELNLDIVKHVVENHLSDFEAFSILVSSLQSK